MVWLKVSVPATPVASVFTGVDAASFAALGASSALGTMLVMTTVALAAAVTSLPSSSEATAVTVSVSRSAALPMTWALKAHR